MDDDDDDDVNEMRYKLTLICLVFPQDMLVPIPMLQPMMRLFFPAAFPLTTVYLTSSHNHTLRPSLNILNLLKRRARPPSLPGSHAQLRMLQATLLFYV